MGFPASPIRVLAFGATLLGCGSAGDTPAPSPDASTSADVAHDTSEPTSDAGPVDAEKQPSDAEKQPPDADPCQGVRCATPPPCDQPCTTMCCCDRTCPPADAAIDGEAAGLDAASKEAGAICSRASDCRLFSDMCEACACDPLGAGAPDPVCPGPSVSCFRDPCGGLSAACVGGYCAAQ